MILRRKRKEKLAFFLSVALLAASLGGCGIAETNTEKADSAGNDGIQNGALSQEAMGRYVEEPMDLTGKISGDGSGIYSLANGNLVVTDRYSEFVKTGDNGAVWMTDHRRWRTKMLEEGVYIMSMAVGPDNTVGLIYQADESGSAEEEESGQKPEDAEETENGQKPEVAEEGETGQMQELNPQLLIIKPDNTEIPTEVPLTEDDQYLDRVYIADSGRIFVTTRGTSNIYEVQEDGSGELFLMVEAGHPDLIQFQGNLMVMDGYGYDSLAIYDMDSGEYIEDAVLEDFIETNYRDRENRNIDSHELYFFFGEEGIIYLAGQKGLYRHVIGGSAMEQLIDGTLCSLGNPAYEIQSMIALENNEFLALFWGGRIIHYVYNPDIPTIPNEKLVVYSLEDNEIVRQAINLYQISRPDIYIQFECGIDEDSVTREDALKSLNTKIMAGEGPDVLLLDNMPLSSYIDKGLLLDLNPLLTQLGGEDVLFENILEAFRMDGQIYAVPCEIKLPVMMADKQYLSGVDDLEKIADMMEELRAANPGQDLIGYCSAKGIMRLFSPVCVPMWMTDSGELNREAVREFLMQTKRIYDAQMDGISDRAVERYQEIAQNYEIYNGVASYEDSDYVRESGQNKMNYIGGYYQALFGSFSCMDLVSIQQIAGFEEVDWMPMEGQGGHTFLAESLLGINAASEHMELAEDFLKVCLSKENQSYLYKGIPVNRAALDGKFQTPEDLGSDGMYGSVVTDGEDGNLIILIYYWPKEEEISRYMKYVEALDTAYIENDIVENAVYEEGAAYFQEMKSLEEAVDNIEKKVSIYLSE